MKERGSRTLGAGAPGWSKTRLPVCSASRGDREFALDQTGGNANCALINSTKTQEEVISVLGPFPIFLEFSPDRLNWIFF